MKTNYFEIGLNFILSHAKNLSDEKGFQYSPLLEGKSNKDEDIAAAFKMPHMMDKLINETLKNGYSLQTYNFWETFKVWKLNR